MVNVFGNGTLKESANRAQSYFPQLRFEYPSPETQCISFLGEYDPASGLRIADNFDANLGGYVLDGKYVTTNVASDVEMGRIERSKRCDNDFRSDFRERKDYRLPLRSLSARQKAADKAPPQDRCPNTVENEGRRAALFHFSEGQAYSAVTDFRTRIFSDGLIDAIGLDPEIATNLKTRQFRPNLVVPAGYSASTSIKLERPKITIVESADPFDMTRDLVENTLSIPQLILDESRTHSLIISKAFDPEFILLGYGALLSKLVTATSTVMLEDNSFSSSSCQGSPPQGTSCRFTRDITPILPEALGLYSAYLPKKNPEILNYSWWASRVWNSVPCGMRRQDSSRCDQGVTLDNVMMFDESVTDPFDIKRKVFPFTVPGYAEWDRGPMNRDTAALFIASLFYYLDHDVGFGAEKSFSLFLKTLSLITDKHMPIRGNLRPLPLRRFGRLALEAARRLWPDPLDPSRSVYSGILENNWLLAKGIVTQAAFLCSEIDEPGCCSTPGPDCRPLADPLMRVDYYLAPGIGTYPNNFMVDDREHYQNGPVPGFGSPNPESHPTESDNHGYYAVWWNAYRPDFEYEPKYVAYQFHGASRYGPCDHLGLGDGGYDTHGRNADTGSVLWEAHDDDLSNLVVFFPNTPLYWQRYRGRCESDAQGYYTEDVSPFGFKVIKAIPEGFSIKVTRKGPAGNYLNYRLEPVDPSMSSADTYRWLITKYSGGLRNVTKTNITIEPGAGNQFGRIVNLVLEKDQPVQLRIERNRRGKIDFLELTDRSTDLDRKKGEAFYRDLRPAIPRRFGFNRAGESDWDTIFNACDPSSRDAFNQKIIRRVGATWFTPNVAGLQASSLSAVVGGIVGAGNPGGIVDPGHFSWQVDIHSSIALWRKCVMNSEGCKGDVFSHVFSAPSNDGTAIPFGFRNLAERTYKVTFDLGSLPGTVALAGNHEYVISLHAESDTHNNGSLCIMESDIGKVISHAGSSPESDLIFLGGKQWKTLFDYRKSSGAFAPTRFAMSLEAVETQ